MAVKAPWINCAPEPLPTPGPARVYQFHGFEVSDPDEAANLIMLLSDRGISVRVSCDSGLVKFPQPIHGTGDTLVPLIRAAQSDPNWQRGLNGWRTLQSKMSETERRRNSA